MVSFGVLGPLRAQDARGPLDLKGSRHRTLLARLLIARGRVVPVPRLIDDLWEQPPRDPTGTIQTFVSDLRRILEPERGPRQPATLLVTAAPGYALRADPDRVDAGRFETLVSSASDALAADPAAALTDLDAALPLWQGPAYAEFAHEPWARAEITRLDELRSLAIEYRARALTDLHRHAEAAAALEQHAHDHPLREPAWHTLALALYRAGRQADALTALRTIRANLRDELGVDPTPTLRRLESDILSQAPHLETAPPPAAGTERDAAPPLRRDELPTESADFTAPPASPPGSRPVFVGRAGERARLTAAARRVAETGRAEPVLITGGEGAGKTALAEAVSAELSDHGWITAWGPSPADRGTPPNWSWTRIVAALTAARRADPGAAGSYPESDTEGPQTAGARRKPQDAEPFEAGEGDESAGPGLGGATGADTMGRTIGGDAADADPAVGRFRARRAVVEYLGAVARSGPVLVVFDDLHWAGEETLELLTVLATTPVAGPVLLVGTYRGTDVEANLAGALARMARAEPVRIPLGGLDDEAVETLAREIAGPEIDAAALDRIRARGQGNPFYTRELARLWREQGDLAPDSVPVGVRDVVRHRLERLPAEQRTVLQQAALLGPDLDFELLAQLTADERLTDEAVAAGLRAGFLEESGPPGAGREFGAAAARRLPGSADTAGESTTAPVVFAHSIVRDVLYREIPPPRRSAWHAKVGALLEHAGGVAPAVLAHHFVRADTRATAPRAGQYARAAAVAAEGVFAPHEAARLWADAVTAYGRAGDVRARLESVMGLVRALAITGRLAEAGRLRAEAIRAAEGLADPELTARVIVAFDVPTVWTDTDDPELAHAVVTAAERALRELPCATRELRCRLLTAIALELRTAEPDRGRAAAEEAEALAARLDNPALLALTLNARFLQLFSRPGRAPERAALGAELIVLAQSHRLPTFEVLGHLIRIQALGAIADFDEADQHAKAVGALAERYDLPLVAFFTSWYAALRTSLTASYEEAEAAYRSASAAHPGTAMTGLQHGLLPLALVCLRVRYAKPLAAESLTDLGPHAPWVRPLMLLDQGDRTEARSALLSLPDPPHDILQELRLALLAEAALALDERPLIGRLHTELLPAAHELAGAGTGLLTLHPVSHYLTLLEAATDRSR